MYIIGLPGWIRAAVAVLFVGEPTLEPPMIVDAVAHSIFLNAALDPMENALHEPVILTIPQVSMIVDAEQAPMTI